MITPPSSMPEEREKKKWIDLVGQSVHTNDDHDLGDIEAVGNDSIVVRKPMLAGVHIHYYYIPLTKTEGWDGKMVWLKLFRDEADREYTKHHAPDPTKYYVKERPGIHEADSYPEVTIIQPRHKPAEQVFTAAPSPTELHDSE
jgi:hypothetical protein